ncbi:MAG: ribosome biogenesis GTPase Der [Myxococcota bacterium]
MKPVVAIVGRPNVGKSTLFNRLARRRLALVEDTPGVTRDRHYTEAEWGDRAFTLVDTGGFVPDEKEVLQKEVRQQAQAAVEEANVILFVVDARAGLTAADQEVGAYLRKSGKPVVLVVNKVDDARLEAAAAEFYRLGAPALVDVSAEHGRNVEELAERILDALPPKTEAEEVAPQDGAVRVAVVGRPNVGKSTLVNALLREDRLITSGVAGTTRDAIDSALSFGGRRFVLTDTAGIRRKATISQRIEQFAVLGALKAIERSDVAVLLMDATEPAVDQDARIAGIAEEKGRPLVVVVNKWDLVKDKVKAEELRDELKHKLKFISYAPILFTSALTGAKVDKVLSVAAQLADQAQYRAPTPQLNKLLAHVTAEHPAPFAHGKPLRLYYVAQVAAAPPTFAFTCNRPQLIPDRYKRYLVNQLRATFDLHVPIRLLFRERPGKAKREAKVARMKGRARGRKQ